MKFLRPLSGPKPKPQDRRKDDSGAWALAGALAKDRRSGLDRRARPVRGSGRSPS